MGRPREFDEGEVVGKAIEFFGERGFDAPSVDEILSQLELNRSSFYKIYASKHGLLREALEAVCRSAESGVVPDKSKSLVVVTLVEVAPVSRELRELILYANALCFGGDSAALGKHLLNRASGKSKGEKS